MIFTRTLFSIAVVVFAFTVNLGCTTQSPRQDTTNHLAPFSVIQGTTSETQTVIHVHGFGVRDLKWTIEPSTQLKIRSEFITPESAGLSSPKNQPDLGMGHGEILRLEIDGLEDRVLYQLRLKPSNAPSAKGDESVFEFKSLNLSSRAEHWDFAVLSCLSDDFSASSESAARALWKANPRMIFLIGDNVYVDYARGQKLMIESGMKIWRRYMESVRASKLFSQTQLRPMFTVWDDHDYGENDGDRNFAFKRDALIVRDAFFPTRQVQSKTISWTKSGFGAGSVLRMSKGAIQNQFLFLDNRSFRSPRTETDPKAQTHFGREQTDWLKTRVKMFPGFTWLISGDQWFGGYHRFESFERNAKPALDGLLSDLSRTKRRIAFLSGDRHMSEVMKISEPALGFETYEFTSSGFHAKIYPGRWNETPNPRQVRSADTDMHFSVFRFALPIAVGSEEKSKSRFQTRQKHLDHPVHYQLEMQTVSTTDQVLYQFEGRVGSRPETQYRR